MYNTLYDVIHTNLTDANVGARKNRSCRDNLFVIGEVTNFVINGESKPIQLQNIDIQQCFDNLWLEATINSRYEKGVTCVLLNIIYIEKENADIAVKVSNALREKFKVKKQR